MNADRGKIKNLPRINADERGSGRSFHHGGAEKKIAKTAKIAEIERPAMRFSI
jgi:hypothetical protein